MKKKYLIYKSDKFIAFIFLCCCFLAQGFSSNLLGNPSIDARFSPNTNACESSDQYCVNVQIKGEEGADLVGVSSIRISYDSDVLGFYGTSNNGTSEGSFTSINFDGDQSTLHPDCAAGLGITPYSEQGFDGLVPGDILMTMVLLNPSIGTVTFACPGVASSWTDVSEICFDVLDPNGNPNLEFVGVQNGDPIGNPAGTNFGSDTNNPDDKYDNGTLEALNTSYNDLCGSNPVEGCTDQTACNYNPAATAEDGSCTYIAPGACDCAGNVVDACGECGGTGIAGCTEPNAGNYNPAATCDDDSCEAYYPGCTQPTACNYDPNAIIDDGSCDFGIVECPSNPCNAVLGCTDATATNYNAIATCDDGSCVYDNNNVGSVDARFVTSETSCEEVNSYCVTVQIKGNDGADLIGVSSIRMSYDSEVLSFSGSSLNGLTTGDFTSINFDDDQSTLHPDCAAGLGISPYSEQGFDGLVPGDILMTMVLLNPSIGEISFACPGTAGIWTEVSEICFDVLDPDGLPNLQFVGVQNGDPSENEAGTNFGSDTNDSADKYNNGTLEGLNTPYSEICENQGEVGCTDPAACNYNPLATVGGDCTYGAVTCPDPCNAILGCTNPEASNYNPGATCDDGTCNPINPPNPGSSPTIFSDYTWLSSVLNPNNCDGGSVTVYTAGNYDFLYVQSAAGAQLYFESGALYCTDLPGFSCVNAYGLTNVTATWACGDPVITVPTSPEVFNEYPWLNSIVNPNNCDNETVVVYQTGIFNFIYVDGVLYFEDGTFYCADAPGFSCVNAYGLFNVVATWNCGDVINPNPPSDIFVNYPWVNTIVNEEVCTDESIIVYTTGAFDFIYIDGVLYFQDGTFYCADSPGYSCIALYGLTVVEDTWSCEDGPIDGGDNEAFETYPWLASLVNPESCEGETISVYEIANGYQVIYVVGTDGVGILYFQDGTFYCSDVDEPPYSCLAAYQLVGTEPIMTWACALGRPAEESCTEALNPIVLCHELDSHYEIQEITQRSEEGLVTILNSSCFRYTPLPEARTNQGLSLIACNDATGNCIELEYKVTVGRCNIEDTNANGESENELNLGSRFDEDATNFETFKMYPNPSEGRVFVNLKAHSRTGQTVTVYDLTGNTISRVELAPNSMETTVELNLESLPSGFYLIEWKTASQSEVQRLIIK